VRSCSGKRKTGGSECGGGPGNVRVLQVRLSANAAPARPGLHWPSARGRPAGLDVRPGATDGENIRRARELQTSLMTLNLTLPDADGVDILASIRDVATDRLTRTAPRARFAKDCAGFPRESTGFPEDSFRLYVRADAFATIVWGSVFKPLVRDLEGIIGAPRWLC